VGGDKEKVLAVGVLGVLNQRETQTSLFPSGKKKGRTGGTDRTSTSRDTCTEGTSNRIFLKDSISTLRRLNISTGNDPLQAVVGEGRFTSGILWRGEPNGEG